MRGDWLKFKCGDHVYDVTDPRHVGIVRKITTLGAWEAEIEWRPGLFSTVDLNKLKKE
jgi:hypothetical protein